MAVFSAPCGCCMGRRQFLATGLAAAAAFPLRRALAQAPVQKPAAKRIDVHHHFMPSGYMKEEHERLNFSMARFRQVNCCRGRRANRSTSWTPMA